MIRVNCVLLLVLVGFFTGCSYNRENTIIEKRVVILPPENLWQCPDIPKLPDGSYTQKDVAEFILKLYEQNKICKESIKTVNCLLYTSPSPRD